MLRPGAVVQTFVPGIATFVPVPSANHMREPHVPAKHVPFPQSLDSVQVLPSTHAPQAPPQSTSVSLPFFAPSVHEAEMTSAAAASGKVTGSGWQPARMIATLTSAFMGSIVTDEVSATMIRDDEDGVVPMPTSRYFGQPHADDATAAASPCIGHVSLAVLPITLFSMH
jgi:hypothetical protein